MKFGKTLGGLLVTAIAVLGLSGTAQAVEVFEYEHGTLFNPFDNVKLDAQHPTYGWTWTGIMAPDPASWTVTSADLYLFLYDDILDPNNEVVRFSFNGASWGTYDVDGNLIFQDLFNFDLSGLDFSTGILAVLLERTGGDFYFNYAKLVLSAVRRVSEPGTLALLGLALMSLGFAARKRAK